MEARRSRRGWLYLRSLFSIYDSEDLARLDLPWWSFGAIDALQSFLERRGGSAAVFEYGSGASTAWLARRAQAVYSVEHDPGWAEKTRAFCRPFRHVTLLEESSDGYVRSIERISGRFDVIVIDGLRREACLRQAVQKVKEDGVIVFDDSARALWSPAVDASGLFVKRFTGLAVSLPYPSETAILSKKPKGLL